MAHPADFGPGQNHRQTLWEFQARPLVQIPYGLVEDLGIKEYQGVEGLVLGRGGHLAVDGKMTEETGDFGHPKGPGMLPSGRPRPLRVPVEPEKSDNPTPIGLLGAPGIVVESQDFADLLPQRRLRIWDDSLLGAMDAGGGFWL